MFTSLIRNTAVSAIAYFVISALGIWVTGMLANTYGLAAYGFITLARLFTTTGLVGIFDLGAPENASYVIARARETGNWKDSMSCIRYLFIFTLIASIICAVAILICSQSLGMILGMELNNAILFKEILIVSAAILPLCLTSQVAEGVIRGFERYAEVRGLEVFTSLLYAIGSWILISLQAPFHSVIYLYICLNIVRALIAYYLALNMIKNHSSVKAHAAPIHARSLVIERTLVVAPNKILSTLQFQSIPLVVGLTVGASGAGVYDLIMRLPRFAKSTLGLLNSAALPFAARLEAANNKKTLEILHNHGMLIVALLAFPPLFALAAMSEPLLRLWVGEALSQYWAWQAFAFSIPLVNTVIGFASTTLFSKIDFLKLVGLMVGVRLVLQYIIALCLMPFLSERAFILGAIIAVLITSIWEVRMLLKLQKFSSKVRSSVFSLFLLCSVFSIASIPIAKNFISTIPQLLFSLISVTLLIWLTAWCLIVPKDFRYKIVNNIKTSFFN